LAQTDSTKVAAIIPVDLILRPFFDFASLAQNDGKAVFSDGYRPPLPVELHRRRACAGYLAVTN
jgi:hypothetical protein